MGFNPATMMASMAVVGENIAGVIGTAMAGINQLMQQGVTTLLIPSVEYHLAING